MKQQQLGRIARYRIFLQKKLPIPDLDGEHLTLLNFDFDQCANDYITASEQEVNYCIYDRELRLKQSKVRTGDQEMLVENMKLNDEDLEGLLFDLEQSKSFEGSLNLGGNNISDQTLFRIASLLKHKIKLTNLSFRGCNQISFLGIKELATALKTNKTVKEVDFSDCLMTDLAANSLIEVISSNDTIEEIHFGKISDRSLLYLAQQLMGTFSIQHLGFQEDVRDVWQNSTKEFFLDNLRTNYNARKLISFTIPIENLQLHSVFIGQLEILSAYNRQLYLQQQSNLFKVKELDTEHPEYYNPDNFEQNAFKFSVKSYLSNVFESLLDESLYFLEKERQNVLRDEEIQKVTNEFATKTIQEDICTSDGSLLVLARYLIAKTRK